MVSTVVSSRGTVSRGTVSRGAVSRGAVSRGVSSRERSAGAWAGAECGCRVQVLGHGAGGQV